MQNRSLSRRALAKALSLAAAAALAARPTLSAEPSKLDVKDPTAVALGYVEDAAQVNPKKYPEFAAGTNCENCLLLQGEPGHDYRPCTVFPGKLVAIKGWCSKWTPEM